MAARGHESFGRTWGWMLALAIISIIGGVLAIAMPLMATIAVVYIAGWFFLLQGVIQIVHAFRVRGWSGFIWSLGLGVLALLLGIMLLADPFAGAISLTVVLAVFFLVSGVAKTMFAFNLRPVGGWGWVLASGLISLALGIMIFAGLPGAAATILGLLLGIELLSNGMLFLFAAMGLRRYSRDGSI